MRNLQFTIFSFQKKTTGFILTTKRQRGFTLIELLVVIAIIGILMGISLVALQGARAAGRDARRKGDLEQIRSALEIYRSDCGSYVADLAWGTPLTGSCPTASTYISTIPSDPQSPTRIYDYIPGAGNRSYVICARLENGGTAGSCPGGSCGGGQPCNYMVTSP